MQLTDDKMTRIGLVIATALIVIYLVKSNEKKLTKDVSMILMSIVVLGALYIIYITNNEESESFYQASLSDVSETTSLTDSDIGGYENQGSNFEQLSEQAAEQNARNAERLAEEAAAAAAAAAEGANQPGANQPGANQPGANQPGANQPGANQPGANQPGANQPGANQPGANQPSNGVQPIDPNASLEQAVEGSNVKMDMPNECYPKDVLSPSELLPGDTSSTWAQSVPSGQGSLGDKNFLNAGYHVGVNTVGQTLRNANRQIRSEPPNPQVKVSPWLQTTIEPDSNRRPLEIG